MESKKCEKIEIMTESMAGWLMFNRFHCLFTRENLTDVKKLVYIFKDTPQIRECMARYNQFKQLLN